MDDRPEPEDQASAAGALRALALRLWSIHADDGTKGYQEEAVDVLVGQLPLVSGGPDGLHGMPLGVPMPKGSHVLGSLVWVNAGGYPRYSILLSYSGYAEDVVVW